jgi:hypothetical protein
MLSVSDAGRIGRLVLPKKCAEVSHWFVALVSFICRIFVITMLVALSYLPWEIAFIFLAKSFCIIVLFFSLSYLVLQKLLMSSVTKFDLMHNTTVYLVLSKF